MNSLFDIAEKVVLITGSTRGIGFSLAKGFLEAGSRVISALTLQNLYSRIMNLING